MAKNKRLPIAGRLERAVSDVANAASVAATGSEIGVLELAVEDELNPRPARKRKPKRPSARSAGAKKPGNLAERRAAPARRSH
jgi:hypothetical protein